MELAKIFNTKAYGQLCAIRYSDEEGRPEIKIFCEPPGVGVCCLSVGFNDSERGWDLQREGFENLTEEIAIATAKPAFQLVDEMHS